MKKLILSLGVLLLASSVTFAQNKNKTKGKSETPKASIATAPASSGTPAAATGHEGHNHGPAAATPAPAPASNLKPEDISFKTETHDFGTIPEGPAADYEFTFVNKGKEPLIIQQVHASCGCTTPSYSKEPVLPGKTGSVKASYATAGRPNAFTKTITVVSNAGTKVLTIKGEVEKAPESSVPTTSSMIKTN